MLLLPFRLQRYSNALLVPISFCRTFLCSIVGIVQNRHVSSVFVGRLGLNSRLKSCTAASVDGWVGTDSLHTPQGTLIIDLSRYRPILRALRICWITRFEILVRWLGPVDMLSFDWWWRFFSSLVVVVFVVSLERDNDPIRNRVHASPVCLQASIEISN